MYWSAEGYIERAELDGLNRRIIASLGETYYGSKIDARGLTLDHEMNRLYFVSYFEYALLYIDLDSGSHSVQVMLRNFLFFWDPFGVAVDDKYVYWNEYSLFGWVFRINKNDTSDFDLLLHGLYDPRGLAVKKGNYTRKSEYTFKKILKCHLPFRTQPLYIYIYIYFFFFFNLKKAERPKRRALNSSRTVKSWPLSYVHIVHLTIYRYISIIAVVMNYNIVICKPHFTSFFHNKFLLSR